MTTTLGVGTLLSVLGELGLEVLCGDAHQKYRDVIRRLGERLTAGGLPPNEHLENAVRRSLAGAALVFA